MCNSPQRWRVKRPGQSSDCLQRAAAIDPSRHACVDAVRRLWGEIMTTKTALLACVVACLAGCVQTATISTPFNPVEHEFAARHGAATISGQAFFRRNDGVVVYAAGSPVLLLPATGYVQEIVAKGSNPYAQTNFTNADQRLGQYIKKGQANGEGRFTFSGLSAGNYLVVTNVTWMAGNVPQGGDLTAYVTVADGQSVETILTR